LVSALRALWGGGVPPPDTQDDVTGDAVAEPA
jgi:hypothetical protein